MPYYPAIREEQIMTLNVVVQKLTADPTYLSHPDCPYSDVVKTFFRAVSAPAAAENPFDGTEDYNVVLDKQIEQVIADLDTFVAGNPGLEANEKLAYFKTKTSLVEKLIGMKERVQNLKELSEFRGTVLGFLDESCTPDQITDLMKRLDGVFGIGGGEVKA